MAGIRASLDKLARLRKRIDGMRRGDFARVVAPPMAAAALKLIADGFKKQQDPYGKPWQPLRHRKGKILQDTGRLRASFKATPKPYGFDVSTDVVYFAAHQFGARIKARKAKESIRFRSRRGGRFISRARALKQKRARPVLIKAHKIGSFRLPKRMMLPHKKLGPTWSKAIERAGRTAAQKYIRAGL